MVSKELKKRDEYFLKDTALTDNYILIFKFKTLNPDYGFISAATGHCP